MKDCAHRVRDRFLKTADSSVLDQLLDQHLKIRTWLQGFPRIMKLAERDAPRGWAWQDPFIRFFEQFDLYQKQLWEIGRELRNFPELREAKIAIEPPRNARIDKAIDDLEFVPNPNTGQEHIVYSRSNLENWYKNFSNWSNESYKVLSSIL